MLRSVLVLSLLVAAACKEKPATPAAADAARPSVAAADAAPSQANPNVAVDATATGVDAAANAPPADTGAAPKPGSKSVGVGPCDDYLDKMARCIAKLSPDSAEPMRQAMEDTRKAWQQTAQTAEGRAALTDVCKTAIDAAKSSAKALGCSW